MSFSFATSSVLTGFNNAAFVLNAPQVLMSVSQSAKPKVLLDHTSKIRMPHLRLANMLWVAHRLEYDRIYDGLLFASRSKKQPDGQKRKRSRVTEVDDRRRVDKGVGRHHEPGNSDDCGRPSRDNRGSGRGFSEFGGSGNGGSGGGFSEFGD